MRSTGTLPTICFRSTDILLGVCDELGLSYHAIALQDNIICHPFVADAIFYYQLAIEVQIKDRIELSALHTMGIINNISQLLSVKGDAGKAEESFALLLKTLMIYVDQVKLSGGRGLHQELDGFVGNVIQVVHAIIFSSHDHSLKYFASNVPRPDYLAK